MKQDLVIVVSKYKLWICIIYVMLLSIIFPLAYADEIGGVIDPYSSLLSILFFIIINETCINIYLIVYA